MLRINDINETGAVRVRLASSSSAFAVSLSTKCSSQCVRRLAGKPPRPAPQRGRDVNPTYGRESYPNVIYRLTKYHHNDKCSCLCHSVPLSSLSSAGFKFNLLFGASRPCRCRAHQPLCSCQNFNFYFRRGGVARSVLSRRRHALYKVI